MQLNSSFLNLRHTREKKLRLLCLGVQMTPKVYLFLGMEFDNFCFVFNVLWVREFIAATAKCVTFTDDLEIQGHMLFYVTIPSSGVSLLLRMLS